MSTDYRKMSHHFIEKAFSSFILIARHIFCGEKVFTRSEIPGVGPRWWEAGAGSNNNNTVWRQTAQPAWRGRGWGAPPPEYADTNVKFVPKINRELKSG